MPVEYTITSSFSMACARMEKSALGRFSSGHQPPVWFPERFSGEIYRNGVVRFRLGVCLAVQWQARALSRDHRQSGNSGGCCNAAS